MVTAYQVDSDWPDQQLSTRYWKAQTSKHCHLVKLAASAVISGLVRYMHFAMLVIFLPVTCVFVVSGESVTAISHQWIPVDE